MVGSTIQHYRIRERLGKGGMGEVYLAEDTRLGREVALKFLPADAQKDADRRARFLTEARAASALRSSNIAAIYDIGQHEGADYIVMEYVEGETLSKRVHNGALPVREAVDIATQVTDALSDAHSRGIVHRDIKSANIIVTARGQAKVLDFGLAKFLQPPSGQSSLDSALTIGEDTMAGTVLGTASYMSPEQALGRNVDQRSDLFSTGVVFYEMLTGKLPFEGKSFGEVVDAILHQQPPPLARLNYGIPVEVDTIIRKALEKNPDVRYQTARDLFSDLQRVKVDLDEVERHGTTIRSGSGSHLHPPASAPENSIAVVTFTNITREPADEWIGSGIAETVSADLKNVQGLSVIGRERVFDALRNLGTDGSRNDDHFAIEIGRGLGARWIVSGAFQRLGVHRVHVPGGFHSSFNLDLPVSIGAYRFSRGPDDPIVVHMMRTPCLPGHPARDQHRAGRMQLFATDFATFERNIRDQLARTLGAGGFDPARDVRAITVNRWPHGYAYQYNSLFDRFWLEGGPTPCETARRRFGSISFANADAGAYSYADAAIDHGLRAAREALS